MTKGSQAIETFMKLEDIAKQRIESIPSLKDIFMNEIESSHNSDGFKHDKGSHEVKLLNNSTLWTLNSIPDNARGKRAELLLIDEAGFTDEKLINVCLPFISFKTDFQLSTDKKFDIRLIKKKVPTQVVLSSSASEVGHIHGLKYKEYALRMLAGDSRYYVADIPCIVPLHPLSDGIRIPPLLEQSEVDDMMKTFPQRCLREFHNKFTIEGGDEQIIKWKSIRNGETFTFPQLFSNDKDELFTIAMDSALQHDNSIIAIMKLIHDDIRGWYGQVVHVTNLKDLKKKGNIQKLSQFQIKDLKNTILDFNQGERDYKKISSLQVDIGHAAMLTFCDFLLSDWKDDKGMSHKGFIDSDHERWKENKRDYPNAWDKLQAVVPQKDRRELFEDLETLMRDGLIEFPEEYNGRGFIVVENENGELVNRNLTQSEILSLTNIDLMKTEITAIHRLGTRDAPRYELPKGSLVKYDDRAYTLALLARRLTQLRRDDELGKSRIYKKQDVSKLLGTFKKPVIRTR